MNKIFVLALALLLSVCPQLQSHHAFSSEFDADRPFRVTGTIVRVEWINPHSWVHVDVLQEDGTVTQ